MNWNERIENDGSTISADVDGADDEDGDDCDARRISTTLIVTFDWFARDEGCETRRTPFR